MILCSLALVPSILAFKEGLVIHLVVFLICSTLYLLFTYVSNQVLNLSLWISTITAAILVDYPIQDKHMNRQIMHSTLSIILFSFIARNINSDDSQKKVQHVIQQKQPNLAKLVDDCSKEIRTITTTIVGYVGLILDTNLSLQQKEYVAALKSSIDYMINFINNVNMYFRADLEAIGEESLYPFHIDVLFDSLLVNEKLIKKESANVSVTSFIDSDIPKVLKGPKEQLEMLLSHLLDNARKFTSHGEIHISAKLISKTSSKCTISIIVKDSGIGISPDKMRRIFTFLNNRGQKPGPIAGSDPGIGLPICSRIAKCFDDGNFSIESKLNEGTVATFTASFQIVRDNTPKISISKNTKVLIFSEEPYTTSMKSKLKRKGFENVYNDNTKEGISKMLKSSFEKGDPFDILFVNTTRKGKEVAETSFVKSLREDPTMRSLRIILIASKAYITSRGAEFFDGYIQRPVLMKQLHSALLVVPNDALRKSLSGGADRTTLNVLIAEDNLYNRVVLKNLIVNEGHDCIETMDGMECFQVFKEKKDSIDLIFMDYLMPVLDGLESTERIREFEKKLSLDRTRIVGLTADGRFKSACLKSGMDDCFIKPADPSNVRQILMQVSMEKKAKKKAKRQSRELLKKEIVENKANYGCILVVEDNPFVAKLTTQLLLRNNWDVDLAIDGSESVERIMSNYNRYECILMDLYLPELDGIAATKLIRKYEKENNLPQKPIIMLTADDTPDVRSRCIDSGCTYYLQKPLNYERFIKLLSKLWKR